MQPLKLALIAMILAGAMPLAQADDAPKQGKKAAVAPTVAVSKSDDKLLQAAKVMIGTGVQDRQLVGEASEFPASAERVYCWTEIHAKDLPAAIKHVWYKEGNKIAEVPLKVTGSPFRTWSSKAIEPGKYKIEIVNDNGGETLASAEFAVK